MKLSAALIARNAEDHIAASLGIPLIAIRGADEPMWDPLGEGIIIQMKDNSAKPCYDARSHDAQAYRNTFKNITAQSVIEKLRSIEGCLK